MEPKSPAEQCRTVPGKLGAITAKSARERVLGAVAVSRTPIMPALAWSTEAAEARQFLEPPARLMRILAAAPNRPVLLSVPPESDS